MISLYKLIIFYYNIYKLIKNSNDNLILPIKIIEINAHHAQMMNIIQIRVLIMYVKNIFLHVKLVIRIMEIAVHHA